MKTIVCFHLFNDYSGSPKVLRMVLEGLLNKGYNVDLVSSCGGVLDELEGMKNFKNIRISIVFPTIRPLPWQDMPWCRFIHSSLH